MYKLSVCDHKTGETHTQRFETLERAQMGMLANVCSDLLWYGTDWSQAGEMLLALLYSASRGELCGALYNDDAPDVVASPNWFAVYGCGVSMVYTIEEVCEPESERWGWADGRRVELA